MPENIAESVDLRTIPSLTIGPRTEDDTHRPASSSHKTMEYATFRFTDNSSEMRIHLVVRLVPRHLRTMVLNARAEGEKFPSLSSTLQTQSFACCAMSFNENIDELTIAASPTKNCMAVHSNWWNCRNGVHVPADAEYVWWGRITLEMTTKALR